MKTRGRFAGIQYLRGIAACAVVLDHCSSMAALPKYFDRSPTGDPFFSRGALGVDLFFIISGFIMPIVSLESYTLFRRVRIAHFIRDRALRILPMMWLAIFSYVLLRSIGRGSYDLAPAVRAFFLFPVGPVDPNVIWTLRLELVFYLFFAITYLAPLHLRCVLWIWFSLPLFLSGLAVLDYASVPSFGWVSFFLSQYNFLFGVGFLIGIVWLKIDWVPPMIKYRYFALILLICLCGLVFMACDIRLGSMSDTAVAGLVFTPVFLLSLLPNSFESRLGCLLGDASYSIYLFHLHFLSAALGVASKTLPNINLNFLVVTTSLLGVMVCVIVHIVIERRVTYFLRRRLVFDLSPRTPSSLR